jgi:hypothetical protein
MTPTPEPVFALIDCNSFYASCERVFRPDLARTPIVVLSEQRSEGWKSLVNPVESAPPSEPLWNSSFQAS